MVNYVSQELYLTLSKFTFCEFEFHFEFVESVENLPDMVQVFVFGV